MKIKKNKNKKLLISAAICLALGGMLGGAATASSQGELDSVASKNSEIISEIASVTTTLESKESEFQSLEAQVSNLESQKQELVKREEETKQQLDAKVKADEQRRLQVEVEAKAKAETQAKAEVQAEAQSSQASSGTTTQNSTSGSNGSGGGGSSGTVKATPSSEQSSVKVWKTATGKKYHKTNNCGNTNYNNVTLITITQAESLGLTPCSKCY